MAPVDELAHSASSAHGQFFAGLNPLDWAIILVLAVSAFTAFLRGLIRSVVSIAGLALGILLGAWYAGSLAVPLQRWIPRPAFAEIAAFVVILLLAYSLSIAAGRLIQGAAKAVGLGFADRLGGAAFGVLRAVLLLAAALVPLSPFLPLIPFTRDSVLLPLLQTVAHGVSFVLPQNFGDRLLSTMEGLQSTAAGTGRPQRHAAGYTSGTLPAQGDSE